MKKLMTSLLIALSLILGCASIDQHNQLDIQDKVNIQKSGKLYYNPYPLITHNVEVYLYDKDGVLKDFRMGKNLVVTQGKTIALQQMMLTASRPAVFDYIGIGTGTNAAAATDIALQTECATSYTRQQDTSIDYGPGGCTNPYVGSGTGCTQGTLSVTFNSTNCTGPVAITESGIFNASTSGKLLARQVFSAINKGASDSITLNWTVSVN